MFQQLALGTLSGTCTKPTPCGLSLSWAKADKPCCLWHALSGPVRHKIHAVLQAASTQMLRTTKPCCLWRAPKGLWGVRTGGPARSVAN